MIASALAVELLVSVLQHPEKLMGGWEGGEGLGDEREGEKEGGREALCCSNQTS